LKDEKGYTDEDVFNFWVAYQAPLAMDSSFEDLAPQEEKEKHRLFRETRKIHKEALEYHENYGEPEKNILGIEIANVLGVNTNNITVGRVERTPTKKGEVIGIQLGGLSPEDIQKLKGQVFYSTMVETYDGQQIKEKELLEAEEGSVSLYIWASDIFKHFLPAVEKNLIGKETDVEKMPIEAVGLLTKGFDDCKKEISL